MVADHAHLYLDKCTFRLNYATWGRGGAVYASDHSGVVANNVLFHDNVAT